MTILRMTEVKCETGHRSHASIYNAIKAGLFPKGVQIGQRSVGWPLEEVQAINAARIGGASESEIRDLVIRLHAKRQQLKWTAAGQSPSRSLSSAWEVNDE